MGAKVSGKFRLIGALLALGAAPMLSGASDGFDSRLVSRHNAERARYGIPPLT